MSEPGGEGGCVRYFCTAGNGMEPFLTEELRRKLEAEDVSENRHHDNLLHEPSGFSLRL